MIVEAPLFIFFGNANTGILWNLALPVWGSPNGARTPKKVLFFKKGSGRSWTLGRIRIGRVFTLFGRQKTRFGRVQGRQGFCNFKKKAQFSKKRT